MKAQILCCDAEASKVLHDAFFKFASKPKLSMLGSIKSLPECPRGTSSLCCHAGVQSRYSSDSSVIRGASKV